MKSIYKVARPFKCKTSWAYFESLEKAQKYAQPPDFYDRFQGVTWILEKVDGTWKPAWRITGRSWYNYKNGAESPWERFESF